MSAATNESLAKTLADYGLHCQTELAQKENALSTILIWEAGFFGAGITRKDFLELHFGYRFVREVYLLRDLFDLFCPPRVYVNKLGQRPPEDTPDDLLFPALGCYFEPDQQQRAHLNTKLARPVSSPGNDQRQGLVLMCWDRIERAAGELGIGHAYSLLSAVGFHEHSHAARAAKLLRNATSDVLQAEETVAQLETYMVLGGLSWRRGAENTAPAIEAMKKLMEKQPDCYKIKIP